MRKEVIIRENGTKRVIHYCEGESMVDASQQASTEINNIIKRYNKTGTLTHVTSKMPFYGDVSEITDLSQAIEVAKRAESEFMKLPAEARLRFDNDPDKLIKFLQDDRNLDEAIKLGLVEKREIPPSNPPKTEEPQKT